MQQAKWPWQNCVRKDLSLKRCWRKMTASYWTMDLMGRSTFGKVIACVCSPACIAKSYFFNHCLTLLTHRKWSQFRWEESCLEGGRWVYYRNELSQDENAGTITGSSLFHFHFCAELWSLLLVIHISLLP